MSDETNASGDRPSGTSQTSSPNTVTGFMMADKPSAALFLLRVVTVVSALLFLLPIGGIANATVWYQRALVASAVTSCIRLSQRLRGQSLGFSRATLTRVLQEDSAHYLVFVVCFMTTSPMAIALIPVASFATLHYTTYCNTLLNIYGSAPTNLVRRLNLKIVTNQQFILRLIAINEIMLMVVIIFMIFQGAASIFIPFVYYRFLQMRYNSQRNPYCRTVFGELRLSAQQLAYHPKCPTFIRSIVNGAVSFISRLAPTATPPTATSQ